MLWTLSHQALLLDMSQAPFLEILAQQELPEFEFETTTSVITRRLPAGTVNTLKSVRLAIWFATNSTGTLSLTLAITKFWALSCHWSETSLSTCGKPSRSHLPLKPARNSPPKVVTVNAALANCTSLS